MAGAAAVAVIGSVIAGGLGAYGAIREGNEAKRAAEAQAARVEQIGREQLSDLERRRALTVASQRQAYSARGVSLQGSPLLLMAETNALAARDASRIKEDVRQQSYELRRAGKFAQEQSRIKATGIVIGSLANAGTSVAMGGTSALRVDNTPSTLLGGSSSRFASSLPSLSVARFQSIQ